MVGIAVEARSLDILRETISRASNDSGKHSGKNRGSQSSNKREELMDYLLDICMNVIQERQMRNEVTIHYRSKMHTTCLNLYRFSS